MREFRRNYVPEVVKEMFEVHERLLQMTEEHKAKYFATQAILGIRKAIQRSLGGAYFDQRTGYIVYQGFSQPRSYPVSGYGLSKEAAQALEEIRPGFWVQAILQLPQNFKGFMAGIVPPRDLERWPHDTPLLVQIAREESQEMRSMILPPVKGRLFLDEFKEHLPLLEIMVAATRRHGLHSVKDSPIFPHNLFAGGDTETFLIPELSRTTKKI